MKKFLTLVLALVLALGLSVPAMAFTSDTTDDVDVPYELSIYLVEYDDNDLFGVATLPESDRGYAKNEIVAAVVELFVPEGEDISGSYGSLKFGGDNVSLNVTDNDLNSGVADKQLKAVNVAGGVDTFTLNTDGDELSRVVTNALENATDDKTYKWLFFAKVTDDDASLYAKLVDGAGNVGFDVDDDLTVWLDGDEYEVSKHMTADGGWYSIFDGDDLIFLYVDEDYKTIGMGICPEDLMVLDTDTPDPDDLKYVEYALGVNTKNELGIVDGAVIDTDSDEYDAVMDVYEDFVVDVFGLDYFLIGNYLRDSFFEDLVSVDTVIATVDIEPWTAYVTVPDNIVVDPPKTGDAASIMGFVMVALSGAGAVALKKRG